MEDVHQPGRILEQNGINMEDVLSTWITPREQDGIIDFEHNGIIRSNHKMNNL
jgi:hypothetical protein